MPTTDVVLWQPQAPVRIPPAATSASDILPHAKQLTNRDRSQILSAFESGHYDLVSHFVWNKSIASLKTQLAKLGIGFIAEMVDRPDIDASSDIDQKLTDYETLRLAQELGVISGVGAFRLRQAMERVHFFGALDADEAEDATITADEVVGIMRACVEGILGLEKVDAALDFKRFRDQLERTILDEDDNDIRKLLASPYFFYRACVRMLLAIVKRSTGAQLENSLANANLIIPLIWERLVSPERFQVGRAYSELVSDGKSTAVTGLKKVLLKVRGFDFVPEDLRSNSFIRAAHRVLEAHEGANNFYKEPAPMKTLEEMGSSIPTPAFPICMTATLSVKLGNRYSISYDAQKYASALLRKVSTERWTYYFNDCLPTDDRILLKLLEDNPRRRWNALVTEYDLSAQIDDYTNKTVKQLMTEAANSGSSRVKTFATRLLKALGYNLP
jgi:hypothetical protein